MGGYGLTSTEILNLSSLEWRAGPALPSPVYDGLSTVYQDTLYLVDGEGEGEVMSLSGGKHSAVEGYCYSWQPWQHQAGVPSSSGDQGCHWLLSLLLMSALEISQQLLFNYCFRKCIFAFKRFLIVN